MNSDVKVILNFIQIQTSPYGLPEVTDLEHCFNDGTTLLCLVDSLFAHPNFDLLTKLGDEFQTLMESGSSEEDVYLKWTEKAIEQAFQHHFVPKLVTAQSFIHVKHEDLHAVIMYLQ
jgi:hypothetical protein